MGILYFLLVGLIAGFLADTAMESQYGLVGNLIIGIVGAILGGFLFDLVGVTAGGLLGNIFMAFVGAIVLLMILKAISKGS